MAYKYISSSSPVYTNPPAVTWQSDFQYWVNEQFFSAPDAFTIQEETTFGSGSLVDVDVRVNRAINAYTGEKLGDDFKLLLFRDLQHSVGIGQLFWFDDNYWISYNSERIKNFAASCVIRRCNNTLRWVDENGEFYSEPCSIDYSISRPRDEMGSKDPVTPAGYVTVYSQLNNKTKKIKGNQRFLFGSVQNRVAFKVFGDGVRNFLNQETNDDESGKLLMLTMGGNYVNTETDDIISGIADINKTIYLLSLNPSLITGNASDSYQLTPLLTFNGNPVNKNISYFTSSSPIATISGSGSGSVLVLLNNSGSCNITAYMTNNPSASAVVPVTVSASATNDYQIRIDPNPNLIYQGDTTSYSGYLYLNGAVQGDVVSFALANTLVPVDHYTFTVVDANHFSIKNNEVYLDYPLTITCSSGSTTRNVDIELRGSY